MKFWKMNGAGNDFVILNNLEEHLPQESFSYLAKTLCERHLSVGADGFMVVDRPTQGGDYRMFFYNADGTMGEMCGNGARCICRYGYENGLAGETQIIETTAGIVTGRRIDQRNYRIRLNDPLDTDLDVKAEIDGRIIPCAYTVVGVPHAIVPYQGLAQADEHELRELGRKLRWYKGFPRGANVNFYEVLGEDHLLERTFERGVEDFTYACGTGTGSVVAILTLLGQVSGKNVKVDMTGGTLTIDVVREGGQIRDLFLTGPTNIVCKGEITDENLKL